MTARTTPHWGVAQLLYVTMCYNTPGTYVPLATLALMARYNTYVLLMASEHVVRAVGTDILYCVVICFATISYANVSKCNDPLTLAKYHAML